MKFGSPATTVAAMSSTSPPTVDLLLSSGFLAFGRHIGFLEAIHAHEVDVAGVYGTSSGALVGAMWAAGRSTEDILAEVTARRPIDWMDMSWTPWSGVFDLTPMVERLRGFLPATFEKLRESGRADLSVGVRRPDGRFCFVRDGDLPSSVAASCAMPWVFRKVNLMIGGQRLRCDDGGAVDRLGVTHWQECPHRQATALVHLVDNSAGPKGHHDLSDFTVVRSRKSGAGFWKLGDVRARATVTRHEATRILGVSHNPRSQPHKTLKMGK